LYDSGIFAAQARSHFCVDDAFSMAVSMSVFGSIVAVAIATFVAGLVAALCHHLIAADFRRRHHEVGSVIFLQLGVMFAVLLAFVFSEAWSEYDEAAKSINLEVSAMHGVAMFTATLPTAEAKRILSEEKSYLSSVVEKEWPILSDKRKGDPETADLFVRLAQSIATIRLSDPDDRDKKSTILSLLQTAHEKRETRIYQAQNGIPIALWFVLIGFTITLALFVAFSAIEYASTAVAIAACFTGGTVSILVLERLLDYPFEGALGLQPDDFIRLIDKITRLMG